MVEMWLFLGLGFICGCIVGFVLKPKEKTMGCLVLQETEDGDGPYLILELDEEIDRLRMGNRAVFRVEHRSDNTRKK